MSIPESALSYGSILTLPGENAEINGKLNNKSIEFTHIAIGDANDEYVQPSRTQATLVNEITRIPVTGMEKIEPSEEGGIPQLKVWAKIPDEIVDVAVREFAAIAVYDGNSYLHAVGNTVRIPILSAANNGGEVNDIYIEMTFAVTSLDPIVMIDPTIVTATRKYVDEQDAKHKAEVDPHPQYALKGEIDTEATRSDEIIKIITQSSNAKIYPEKIGASASTDGDYTSPMAATHLIVNTGDGLKLVEIVDEPATGTISALDTSTIPMTATIGGTDYDLYPVDLTFLRSQMLGIDQSWQLAETTDTGATFTDGTPSYRAVGVTYENDTGRPFSIAITASSSAGGSDVYINGVRIFDTDSRTGCSIIIPPDTVYRVEPNLPQLWFEFRGK